MKKFNFKLQSVLKYRSHLENLARQEAMKALMDITQCENAMAQIRQERQSLALRIEQETTKGVSAQMFRHYNDYLDALDADIVRKENEKIQLNKVLAVKQQTLIQKGVERKAIERLKEKKRAEYIDEMMAEEQKIADDIASLKKARGDSHDLS